MDAHELKKALEGAAEALAYLETAEKARVAAEKGLDRLRDAIRGSEGSPQPEPGWTLLFQAARIIDEQDSALRNEMDTCSDLQAELNDRPDIDDIVTLVRWGMDAGAVPADLIGKLCPAAWDAAKDQPQVYVPDRSTPAGRLDALRSAKRRTSVHGYQPAHRISQLELD